MHQLISARNEGNTICILGRTHINLQEIMWEIYYDPISKSISYVDSECTDGAFINTVEALAYDGFISTRLSLLHGGSNIILF